MFRILAVLGLFMCIGGWRNERVVRAGIVSRPIEIPFGQKLDRFSINHRGIVTETDQGNRYLIHGTPKDGVVATHAHHMSSNWKTVKTIEVNGKQTVGQVLNDAAGLGKTSNPTANYILSGTCIGAAHQAEKKLQTD